MPAILFIWHKFFQPLIDRWYGKPQLESGKEGDGVEKLGEKELLTSGEVKPEVSADNDVMVGGHVKSD